MVSLKADNVQVYRRRATVERYERSTGLQPPEQLILNRFFSDIQGKRVLDIGVGGGRTTEAILPLAGKYTGINISPEMIDHCRRRFPAGDFAVCDAADLSRFADQEFDVSVFSYNGLDYLDPTARLRALGEIRRVLASGGLFVFSSHNRANQSARPWNIRGMNLDPFHRPGQTLVALASLPINIVNHLRLRPFEVEEEGYSLRNDIAHSYTLLTYYISVDDQIKQLEACGFCSIQSVTLDGRWLEANAQIKATDSPWIYYVCRKDDKHKRSG